MSLGELRADGLPIPCSPVLYGLGFSLGPESHLLVGALRTNKAWQGQPARGGRLARAALAAAARCRVCTTCDLTRSGGRRCAGSSSSTRRPARPTKRASCTPQSMRCATRRAQARPSRPGRDGQDCARRRASRQSGSPCSTSPTMSCSASATPILCCRHSLTSSPSSYGGSTRAPNGSDRLRRLSLSCRWYAPPTRACSRLD